MVCARILVATLSLAAVQGVIADSLAFLTWNINGGQASAAVIEARARLAAAAVGPVDVLMLQEVVSVEQVAAAARGMDLGHYAISDLAPPTSITGAWHESLEVAVASRLPLEGVAEWDTTGREPYGDDHPPRTSAEGIESRSLTLAVDLGEARPTRGFLRADLAGGWSVYSVHWKSSRGESCNAADIANARLRERQAAGLVSDARERIAARRTVVVGGDYNIQAPGRALRVGTDPAVDCRPAGSCEGVCGPAGRDGYDDSIHQLMTMAGRPRLLSASLDETYVRRRLPGGAIDHILVAGAMAGRFDTARTPRLAGELWFGSDHRPVLARARLGSSETLRRQSWTPASRPAHRTWIPGERAAPDGHWAVPNLAGR